MADKPARDPNEAFAQRIARLEATISELSTSPFIVPIVNSDPAADVLTNLWAYPDGKLNLRLKDGTIKQYAPVAPAPPPAPPAPPPPQPVTRQNTWTATWGQAYRANGGTTGANNAYLYQGSSGGDSYNGRQRSLIGFDHASIQSALAGSQIAAVEMWLYMRHTYWNDGGTLWFGLHNNASKPGSWAGQVGMDFVSQAHVPSVGGVWVGLSTAFGSILRDGGAKGVTLQAPNDDRTFYGYAAGGPGTGGDIMPRIRITYVK